MLVYRPSRGNDTVTLTYNGEWTGQSIGREVVIKDKFGPEDYFFWYYPDLTSESTWFYKPATSIDFLTGTTYYRALYVGPHERENLQEYIGTIASSVDTCTSGSSATSGTSGTSDLNVSLWNEGLFTINNSQYSIVLDNESDTTNKLASATFTPSVVINQTLSVGQYIKLWVKVNIPQNTSLIDQDNCYFINIGNLSIPLLTDDARLSLSRIFHGNLNSEEIILKELIPKIDEIGQIHKILNKDNDKTHIFFNNITGGTFHDLIIQRKDNVDDNKYIYVDASAVTNQITGFDFNSIKAMENVFTCTVSGNIETKYIVDIIATNLNDRSHFYVFYNKLNRIDSGTVATSAETFDKYEVNYGHNRYYWSAGVIHLDFNAFKNETFDEIQSGYDNKIMTNNWTGIDYTLKNNFFITSISLQDDLFTAIGYNTENSYQTTTATSAIGFVDIGKNYFTELMFLWEKDILLGDISLQIQKTPEISEIKTVKNRSNDIAQLTIDNYSGIDSFDLQHYRSILQITDISGSDLKYCDMGSPHGNKLKHYTDASISFDTQNNYDEWCSTIAFRFGVVTSLPSGYESFDAENAIHNHNIYTSQIPLVTGGTLAKIPLALPPSISGNIKILSVNIKNTTTSVMDVYYEDSSNTVTVETLSTSGSSVTNTYSHKMYLGQENTITINSIKKMVYDSSCVSKNVVNINLYINGVSIFNGNTYVFNSIDPLIVTYNPDKTFSGALTYFELRPYVDNIARYAKSMYRIHSNIAWARILDTLENKNTQKELQVFKKKRYIYFNNLPTVNEQIIVPIVLQGKGYAFEGTYQNYNKNVLRTYDNNNTNSITFDFKDINLNDIDIAFTEEGNSNLLEWIADEYDVLNDRLVVWVKLDSYKNQKIIMYYNSQRIEARKSTERPNAFKDMYGVWTMNKIETTYGYRFVDQKIFNCGENVLYLERGNEKYAIQIDYQYMYGVSNVYKSNKFDILIDDRNTTPETTPYFESFIKDTMKLFKPDYMTINKVKSKYDYRLESENYTPRE